MSRRRKNAGQGYGMMFHGAFSEKKDAVAKEHKTKKAFIRGTPTKHGYRYIVMGPRTNPIKRKPRQRTIEVIDREIDRVRRQRQRHGDRPQLLEREKNLF